jgi:DNA (cytosine-5)-methyltransferase 1
VNELALFAGAGGGILGGLLLGWRTVCAVECDPYARDVLVARQNDGCLAPFPIWDDVCTFDGRPWRGVVDVVSGGFPCQDISAAGRGAGITGERSGLWREMARIVGEVQPAFVLAENSPRLAGNGLATVLSDLAALGYDARWAVVAGKAVGCPFPGERLWLLAAKADRQHEPTRMGVLQDGAAAVLGSRAGRSVGAKWWGVVPIARGGRVDDGVANRMDRLRCIGNGQVPPVVRVAWSVLIEAVEAWENQGKGER